VAEGVVPTPAGSFRAYSYRSRISGEHHLALVCGERLRPDAEVADPVLVRVQKEHLLSDVFSVPGALPPLVALQQLAAAGDGVFLHMRDTNGHGLPSALVHLGGTRHLSTPDPEAAMDARDYGTGAQILHHLGVRRMRLVTGSDRHIAALTGHGLEVVERVRPQASTEGVPL
jgi:3,4-dihydroxy 2-butanone 4-phosphate synthase / GTP cyclohydrolase II